MTAGKIKENAEAYASKKFDRHNPFWEMRRDDYLTGAHSRDEEIAELIKENVTFRAEKEAERQMLEAERWGKDDWGFQ